MMIPSTVVVTGATGGMGRAICSLLAHSGTRVLGVGRQAEALAALERELPAGLFTGVVHDFLTADWAALEAVLAAETRIAGLVTAAGVSRGAALAQLEEQDWRDSFAINVDAPMRLSQLCVPSMARHGAGSIVHIGSPVGLRGARKPSYAASKAALLGLTMSMAQQLGPQNIRVNLLLPGPTITGMTEDWDEPRRAEIAASTYLKRLCTPEEVARVVRFLLSEESSYMTGTIVDVSASGFFGR